MKSQIKKSIVPIAAAAMSLAAFGCSESAKVFGEFTYYGKALVEYAVQEISASDAMALVRGNRASANKGAAQSSIITDIIADETSPKPDDDDIKYIMSEYGSCNFVTTYYTNENGKANANKRADEQGSIDLEAILKKNEYVPYGGLVIEYIYINDEIITYMEDMNAKFKASEAAILAPFKNIFTYHKNASGDLVLQINDYADIPSSVSGGIGCSFLQSIEIVYDSNNKATKWQTSLGLRIATSGGTQRQGYILETDFEWVQKQ